MQDLKERITRLANARGSVLIRGESGVGKELVARAIHRAGPRADRPMLSVNCAAIPHELMESQLFGHKAGAFTGPIVIIKDTFSKLTQARSFWMKWAS